jgi:hypothetical protein
MQFQKCGERKKICESTFYVAKRLARASLNALCDIAKIAEIFLLSFYRFKNGIFLYFLDVSGCFHLYYNPSGPF